MRNKGAAYMLACLCLAALLVLACPLCAGADDATASGGGTASVSANESTSSSADNAANGENTSTGSSASSSDDGSTSTNNVLEGDDRNYVDERQIPNGSFLYETSIETLATADVFYDNSTVVVTGEVVGDRRRGLVGTNSSWITLYSLPTNTSEHYAPVSVEVYVSDSLTETIDSYGAYSTKGTYVQVNGTFHLACSEHEGISDIHADALSIVEKGEQHAQDPQWWAFVPGLVAVLAGALVMLVNRVLVNRSR